MLLYIDKPARITSFDVIRIFGIITQSEDNKSCSHRIQGAAMSDFLFGKMTSKNTNDIKTRDSSWFIYIQKHTTCAKKIKYIPQKY
jgi:hypothetical protein